MLPFPSPRMKPHKFSNPRPPNSNLPPTPVRRLLPTPEPAIAMATKLFLALQCVQCDTMQVKQEKKSSNKWVCVVCNQRQSVLRVHARGYRAADLRRFVQDANLARGRREFAPLAEPEAGWDPAAVEEQGDEFPTEKKRTDWSEYLDDPGEHRDGCCGVGADASDGESDEGIEVITELPQNRPKVRPRKAQSGVLGKRTKPSTHPTLSKRQQIEQGSSPYCATTTADAQRSKWSKYLDVGFFEERKGSQSSGLHWSELDECATTEATSDVVVDDEVHPDFI
ncbi:MRN complex-interacting protein [Panicum hallii]|uniref:MRN complex-interacting protein n=1 Tax=Panicum hallii TaxID=206008 RepID=UPI000DF4CC4C|nr:MRN complex-interacting protein [Panicum hallii]